MSNKYLKKAIPVGIAFFSIFARLFASAQSGQSQTGNSHRRRSPFGCSYRAIL